MSSNQVLDSDRSPQGRALDWITNEDEAQLCPDSPNLTQRYIMAVFYYSTDGDKWDECSAGSASRADKKDKAAAEEKPVAVALAEARKGGNKNKNKNRNKDNNNKGAEDNCLKYCRDKCCDDDGGRRLCNKSSELECRADCFVETQCNWEKAKKQLEKKRKGNDSSKSGSRDRDKKNKNDKRKRKKSKKGGRSKKSRRLQVSAFGQIIISTSVRPRH